MRYINTKTGVTFDSPCSISGGDWKLMDEPGSWAVTHEEDGKVHVRPVVDGEVLDTPIESLEDYTDTKVTEAKPKRTPKKR